MSTNSQFSHSLLKGLVRAWRAWASISLKSGLSIYRLARRAAIFIGGSAVLLVGVFMIVLPGPAIIVIPLGLMILAIEFAWARYYLNQFQTRLAAVQQRIPWLHHKKPRFQLGLMSEVNR
jgi:uncharacterized protein (TIGR02611 family)